MFNFFQQPYTLIGAAVFVLFVVLTIRSVWPEKFHIWHFLLPLVVVGLAFGLDHLVKTDIEQVHSTLETLITAIEEEDYSAIEASIAPDYKDSFHNDRNALLAQARRQLTRSLVEKTRKIALAVRMTPPNATSLLTVVIRFDKDSYVAQSYRPAIILKIRLFLCEQPDGSWLINRSELLEIDRQPMGWRQI